MAVMAIGLVAAYLAPAGYAALAYAVASTAATMLLAKKTKISQEGSRLQDLKVSTSAYGNPIPVTYGTCRMAGNMIWGPDLIETKHVDTQSQGGKGGGGSEVTNTTYTYSSNCAFLLCEGVIKGVKRIWAEGKMIYDLDTNNSGYVGDLQAKIKVYTGTETQLPDPTIEGIEGVGNVEAYRGWAYIVFSDLQLASFGNRIPSFTFEVIKSDDDVEETQATVDNITIDQGQNYWTGIGAYGVYYNPVNKSIVIQQGSNGVAKYNPFNSSIESFNYSTNANDFKWVMWNGGSNAHLDFTYDGDIIKAGTYQGQQGVGLVDGDTLQLKRFCKASDFTTFKNFTYGFTPPRKHIYIEKLYQYIGLYYNDAFSDTGAIELLIYDYDFTPNNFQEIKFNKKSSSSYSNGFYYNRKSSIGSGDNIAFCVDQQNAKLYYLTYQQANTSTFPTGVDQRRVLAISRIDLESYQHEEEYQFIIADNVTGGMFVTDVAFDQTTRSLLIYYNKNNNTYLMRFNIDSNTIAFDIALCGAGITTITDQDGVAWNLGTLINQWTYNLNVRKCFFQYNSNSGTYGTVALDIDQGTMLIWKAILPTNPDPNHQQNLCYVPELTTLVSAGYQFNGGASMIKNIGKRFGVGTYNLSEVVLDLATRSGLTSSDIDVTTLVNDNVRGYIVANVTTIRGCLEQLAQAYNFDIVETDWKMKFVKCGQQVVKVIDYKNLSCKNYSPDIKFDDDIVTKRTQELELPKLVNFTYLDIETDYQQNTQDCSRETVYTNEIQSVEIPLALNKDDAKKIAQRLMYNFWIQRDSYSFETNYDYIDLEPCDIIQLTKNGAIYTMKIVKKEEDGGIIKFNAICEDSAVYNQFGKGGEQSDQTQTIGALSTTKTYFIDMPIVQASDNNAGFYIGAGRQSSNMKWPGSALYSSMDQNGSYNNIESFFNDTTAGSTLSVLGNFTGGNVIDYINTIDVKLINGELETVSEEKFLSGFNVAVVGKEYIGFKNATLLPSGAYRLSTLLRGRWNTEDQINIHSQGDTFILMNTSGIKRLASDPSIINQLRFYKNPTLGKTLNETAMNTFRNTGKGLQCYAVDDFQANRNNVGDLSISWKSRVRGNGLLMDNQDIYDPDGDVYEIDIYNSASTNIIRTININNAKTYIYTSSQQIADFGSNQLNINMRVYKINNVIGRGKANIVIA